MDKSFQRSGHRHDPALQNLYGNLSQFYSLPGACPSKDVENKTPECIKEAPGGNCQDPQGGPTCTWNLEPAGSISLDALAGIKDYRVFCAQGLVEYDPVKDRGN